MSAPTIRAARLNRWFTLLFAILLTTQVLYLLIGLAGIPLYARRVTTQTVAPVAYYGEVRLSNEIIAQLAAARELSLGQYTAYRSLGNAAAALIPLAVAILIVWRAGWQWFAWYTAFILVFLGGFFLDGQTQVSRLIPFVVLGAKDIFWPLVLLYLFLFPNGRAVPRRSAWLMGALVLFHFCVQAGTVIAYAAPDLAQRLHLPNWGNSLYVLPVQFGFVVVLVCQVYRYRQISSAVERLQTRWFLYGLALIVAFVFGSTFFDATGRSGFLADFLELLFWMPLTFSLAIAILRYRLWDIDVIIRKTLVYGVLTALLGLVYAGSVILLQQLIEALTGQRSPLAVVLSTLVIAALFSSLRRRVQDAVDRRFFRNKVDAAAALAGFAAAARDETDLDALTGRLVAAAQETMQPERISLWLKP